MAVAVVWSPGGLKGVVFAAIPINALLGACLFLIGLDLNVAKPCPTNGGDDARCPGCESLPCCDRAPPVVVVVGEGSGDPPSGCDLSGVTTALRDIRDEVNGVADHLRRGIKVEARCECGPDDGVLERIEERLGVLIGQLSPPIEVTVTNSGGGVDGVGHCQLAEFAPVRGFPVGGHEPKTAGGPLGCGAVATGFLQELGGRRLGHLVLVGRADRMPLVGAEGARYGGNRGLAQARAAWVRDCLRQELPLRMDAGRSAHLVDVLENRTILLGGGPLHVPACCEGPKCDPESRHRDRSVDLFACLNDSAPLAVAPMPAAIPTTNIEPQGEYQ